MTALLSRHMDDDDADGRDHLRQLHDEVEHFRMATGLPRRKKMLVTFTARGDDDPELDAEAGRGPEDRGAMALRTRSRAALARERPAGLTGNRGPSVLSGALKRPRRASTVVR